TRRVMDAAEEAGLVFAVDPTSADASCIGGKGAPNDGGEKAGLLGKTGGKLLSGGPGPPPTRWLPGTPRPLHLSRIHDSLVASFDLAYHAVEADGTPGKLKRRETLSIPGGSFRKTGLGKDVTDKYLCGLPGVQKEGCDGIITSARFVLHRMPPSVR